MDKQERQQELDVRKWNDSVDKGFDTCGSYDYCAACDKSVEYPCATAEEKSAKPAKATKKPAAKKAPKKAKASK